MIGLILAGIGAVILVLCMFAWYKVVPPSEAHLVVTPRKRFVASSDAKLGKKTAYFAIPNIPFIGRKTRIMDVTIKELLVEQETYEKDQARYHVRSSLKYRIVDVVQAAETFISDKELKEQLQEIVNASVRAVTVKYNVVEARANKSKMSEDIAKEITDDLRKWGLELINFVLVDFQDTEHSKIISDISRRREVEIEAETRELNAEKFKQARVKEADAEEIARKREIMKEEQVGMREENKAQKIAEEKKLAEEKRLEVVKVQQVTGAQIEKEKQIVVAEQERDVETVRKEQKRLEGEGDRDRAIEQAKGEAAPIRERGFAEAAAKEKLQQALNKFKDEAIRALVAEQIVDMQKQVGLKSAEALAAADLRIFSGGGVGKQGFDLGEMLESLNVSNHGGAAAVLNKIARPNDLGLSQLQIEELAQQLKVPEKKERRTVQADPSQVPQKKEATKVKKEARRR